MDVVLDFFVEHYILIVLIIGLGITTFLSKPFVPKRVRIATVCLEVVVMTLTISDAAEKYYSFCTTYSFSRLVYSVIGYCLRPAVVYLIFVMIEDNKKISVMLTIPAILNALLYLTAFFSHITFWFDENNEFQRGPIGLAFMVTLAFYVAHAVYVLIQKFGKNGRKRWLYIAYCILIGAVSAVLEIGMDHPGVLNTIFIIIALFYYIYLYIQFVEIHSIGQEEVIKDQRNELLTSQITPHFVFNTLGTIRALCERDPKLCGKTIENFSDYLRGNIDSISEKRPIPIKNEIRHAKAYAEIEMIRFDYISVTFEAEDTDFFVPSLTIQPLVENAIKHGVRSREKGIVTVRTRKEGNNHILVIEDNGVGFDPKQVKNDGRVHVGYNNVKERVEKIGGKFIVESTIGVGTKITIVIGGADQNV